METLYQLSYSPEGTSRYRAGLADDNSDQADAASDQAIFGTSVYSRSIS
jgi:hypothetical protein